MRSRAVIVLSN